MIEDEHGDEARAGTANARLDRSRADRQRPVILRGWVVPAMAVVLSSALAVVGSFAGLAGAQDAPATIRMTEQPDFDDSTPIVIRLAPEQTKATTTVYLSQSGDSDLDDVTFSADGLVVDPAKVTIPKGRVPMPVTLSVDGPPAGKTTVGVLAIADGSTQRVATITVQREVLLTLPDIDPEKGLVDAAPTPDYNKVIRIQSFATTDTPVTIVASDLTTDGENPVKLDVTANGASPDANGQIVVPAGKTVPLLLHATLDGPGEYKGTLQLVYRGPSDPVVDLTNVRITRSNAALSLAVDATRAANAGTNESDVPITLEMKENAGREVELTRAPELVKSVVTHDGRSDTWSGTAVLFENGQPIAYPYKIERNGHRRLEARVNGATGPGVHTAALRFGDGTSGEVEVPITINIRRGFPWVVGAILIGIMVAGLLRLVSGPLLKRSRSDLNARLALNNLVDGLNALGSIDGRARDAADQVVASYRHELFENPANRGRLGRHDTRPSIVTTLDTRAPTIVRLVYAWRAAVAAGSEAKHLDQLDRARQVLSDVNSPGEKFDNAKAVVETIITDVTTDTIAVNVARVQGVLTESRPSLPGDVVTTIEAKLSTAGDESMPAAERRTAVEGADRALASALVDVLAATLVGSLSGSDLYAVPRDQLVSLQGRGVAGELTLDQFSTGQVTVVRGLLSALASIINGKVHEIEGNKQKEKTLAELTGFLAQVQDALAIVESDPKNGLAVFRSVAGSLKTRSLGVAAEAVPDLSLAHLMIADPAPVEGVTTAPPLERVPVAVALGGWGLTEALLWVAIVIITLTIGVMTLWAPAPTWGDDSGDWTAAIFWGLGLSAGAVAGIVGTAGARDALLGGAEPKG